MEFRVLYLKILLTEKKYNVGIYLKISEEKKTSPSSVCLWHV